MPINQITKALYVNPSLLAFKPRQIVLLSEPQIMKLDDANGIENTLIINPEQQNLLFHSIAQYLQRRGFSKTLKKFLSEARVQDDLGDSSFDLEEVFCKFLDMCSHVSKNSKSHKAQDLKNDGCSRRDGGGDVTSAVGLLGDGKKKKKKKSDTSVGDKASNFKNSAEVITDDAVPGGVKSKEKKRNKNDSCSLDQEKQVIAKVLEEPDHGTSNKSKDNKRKKNKQSSDPAVVEQEPNKSDSNKDDFHSLKVDVTEKENKSSKKRKRVASQEDSVEPAAKKQVEESKGKKEKSKRRKTESSDEPRIAEEPAKLNSPTRIEEKVHKEGSSQVGSIESQKTSSKQVDGLLNGSLEEDREKCASQQTMKKQQNGSAEPKTVKHFQRVKADEVVFSDERLKDNSYWAKDGAENGYGAKAQEVLGQVRGRGFRHEKTKKKRGSYRGGPIDLHSHSVKFNYSDDD